MLQDCHDEVSSGALLLGCMLLARLFPSEAIGSMACLPALALIPLQEYDKYCHIIQSALLQSSHDQSAGDLLCNCVAHMALALQLFPQNPLRSRDYFTWQYNDRLGLALQGHEMMYLPEGKQPRCSPQRRDLHRTTYAYILACQGR